MEAQARRPSVSSQRRRSTVERLLGLAPAAPTTDPNQVEVAQSVTSSPLEENLEALETLKEVSLHALSVLVRQLVDAEPPESAVSNEASSPVIPRALIPRSFSTPHTALSSIADKESIEDVTERAEHIPDGGEIAAVLKQSTHDRARSADLLSRSRDKLAGLDSNAAEAGPGVSTSASPLGSASCSEARTSPGHVRSGEDIFTDHGLALALAALCNGLYQLLDITYATPAAPASPRARSRRPSVSLASQASNTTATPPAGGDDAVYSRVVEHMSAVQTHRQQVQLADLRPDQQTLWAEIDRLMVLVQAICSTRQQSASPSTAAEPRLSAVKSTQPPSYQEVLDMGGKVAHSKEKGHRLSIDELGQVVSAIDRVFRTAPRLDNQSVLLNARQEKVMSAAALTALIDRLNRGKEPYQTQRATPPAGNNTRWTLGVLRASLISKLNAGLRIRITSLRRSAY
ncbi:hypothetical protein BC832DRAFT_211866 [Gaertneriomyces semiglobifer]|nr:hypothetical protein BC832DRAFT_211866 [Gaertneriomyces semiglobifer]